MTGSAASNREELGAPAIMAAGDSLLGAALAYAARGWPVFPCYEAKSDGTCSCGNPHCDDVGKHPRVSGGFHAAATDEKQIRAWWTKWPSANVAVSTHGAGLLVMDLDRKVGDGVEQFGAISTAHGGIPPTPKQITGSGGFQLFFQDPSQSTPSSIKQFAPDIDVKAQGGYVIVPPSTNRFGAYRWDSDLNPDTVSVAVAPEWLVTYCASLAGKTGGSSGRGERPRVNLSTVLDGLPDGERDTGLFRAACKLRGADVPREFAEDLILRAAGQSCPPVAEDVALKKVDQAWKYPAGLQGSAPTGEETNGGGGKLRPTITVGSDICKVVNEAERALISLDPLGIFQRGGALVRVVRDQAPKLIWLERDPGAPVAALVTEASLTERMATAAIWTKQVNGGAILPPRWAPRTLLDRGEWNFPVLESLTESPRFLPDGSVLDRPGYDERTGILFTPTAGFRCIPDAPSITDAQMAWRTIVEPFLEFPFIGEADLSVFVSAILSVLARPAIRGPVPGFAFRAPTPGSGKGLLADSVALIATGRAVPKMAAPTSDDETRKRLLSLAIEGDAVACVDNISGSFGSPALALALTTTEYKDRLLGENRMLNMPLKMVWLFTGNNLRFRGDLGRRVLPCDLDPKQENPEDRTGFRYPHLLAHVREHRATLLSAGLTVLRAYHLAGRPSHGHPPKGSFESWDALVRGALVWIGVPDPLQTVSRVREEGDEELVALRAALRVWHDSFGIAPSTASSAVERSASVPDLKTALADVAGCAPKDLDAAKLGYSLRTARGRIANGMCFARAGESPSGAVLWRVVPNTGDAGNADDDSRQV